MTSKKQPLLRTYKNCKTDLPKHNGRNYRKKQGNYRPSHNYCNILQLKNIFDITCKHRIKQKIADLRKIVFFLISAFFFFRYVIFPIISIFVNLLKLAKLKKSISDFGKEIVKLQRKQSISKKTIFFYCIFAGTFILFGILTSNYLLFLGSLVFLPTLLELLVIKIYTKYNGIYESGIVFGLFLGWKDVFSWKIIDTEKISILKQDGMRFDLKTDGNQQLIIDYFKSKGIPEETENHF